ncbi:MAG TPA: aspartate--tRNA ligase [Acidimicrobiia bacterium]|nr:aspartate--tRNA ligase [Acidimicrobiia bacterium]
MMRTHHAGELRAAHAREPVAVCGWVHSRRDHGGVVFIDLRDASGLVQVVLDPGARGLEAAHGLRSEWVLRVEGRVRPRPEGTVNPDLPTGEIEVAAESLEILSEAETPPFPLDERADVDESLRLRYRYVDLRRPRMQANLRLRSKLALAIRHSMEAQGFVDVQTPTLTRSTPEGARDFLVPSRKQPGTFYALPQSPQLFKQLLMVAGLDRYYQIATCWRDEDLRADRAYEFVQLDAEASFVDADDVMGFVEEAVGAAIETVTGSRPSVIPRMSWHDAMQRYGSDKPDTRFGMEMVDLSSVFAASEFRAFASKAVTGLTVPGGGETSRSRLDAWTDRAKAHGGGGLVWMRVQPEGLDSPVAKFLTDAEKDALVDALAAKPGDLLLLVADDDRRTAQRVLGTLRLEVGAEVGLRPERLDDPLALLWVTEFPLFEAITDACRPIPAHHPFTAPHPDDLGILESDPLAARSLAYDLVVNGIELGSGSVRIHDRELQARIFSLLGIDEETAQERFGFLLDAFRYGVPPHAGFAFGLDRLAMVLAGEQSLRDVIAFPKTQSGSDPLTGAPAPVDDAQLHDLGLRILPPK